MVKRIAGALVLIAVFFTTAASAQAQQAGPEERLIHWHVMGGYSDTLGTTSNYLQGGYIFGGGFSLTPAWADTVLTNASYTATKEMFAAYKLVVQTITGFNFVLLLLAMWLTWGLGKTARPPVAGGAA